MMDKLKEYLPSYSIKEERNTIVLELQKKKRAYPLEILLSMHRADLLPELFIRSLNSP
jgi:hypothetical protein